jgi:hypothetical protein
LNWGEFGPSLVMLVKSNSWGSWVKSRRRSLLVDNPVEVVSSSDVGLFRPLNFIGNIMLVIGPGVVSLGVWGDVGFTVLSWIS